MNITGYQLNNALTDFGLIHAGAFVLSLTPDKQGIAEHVNTRGHHLGSYNAPVEAQFVQPMTAKASLNPKLGTLKT